MSLVDTFGRVHDSLRISVTDRCNIRCFYCMPEEGAQFQPRAEILSFEEIERVVRVAVGQGVDKLRLTGGEPLVRRDLPILIARLAAIQGVRDLALTTNAVLLARDAHALHDAGLRRLNIHLDTLDRARFHQMTRRDDLPRVLDGIAAARALKFSIKLNAVAVRGLSEPDILPIARFCRDNDIEARFIEFMPLDAQNLWDRSKVLSADEILGEISTNISPLRAIPDSDPRAPATEYRYSDTGARVGVIASVTKPFCLNCNRLRLTSDGKVRYCLFAVEETDIKPLLRNGGSDIDIAGALRLTTAKKWLGHQIDSSRFVPPPRPMYSIGG
ncbi:MAG: cyclohydrolase subunit MoaA [Bryobacterales bacterium]|nr:cyclohydrolase subunit MoaA [Bryobacterales bacterium]